MAITAGSTTSSSKFRPGDKVMIRKYRIGDPGSYCSLGWASEMDRWDDRILTLKESGIGRQVWKVVENDWNWHEDWMEPVSTSERYFYGYGYRPGYDSRWSSSGTQYHKPKECMSVIKNIFKSKERKALEFYGLVNGDGGLTSRGREEFLDYLWQNDKESREEFTKLIVEEYKKEKKNK